MRKGHFPILLMPVIFLLTATMAFAQKKLNFRSVEFGLGPAMVSMHDNDPLIDNIPKPSFAASGGLVYSLKRNLFITTHVMYELKGGKSTRYFPNGEGSPISYNTTTSYATWVVAVRRYLFDGDFFVEGGPFIAFLLSSNTTRDPSQVRWTNVDAGLSAAVGYTPFRPQYKGFNIKLVNNLGMTDVNLRTGTKEWTNSLALILGFRIRMN